MKLQRFLILLVGLSMPFNNVAIAPNVSVGLATVFLYFVSLISLIQNCKQIRSYENNIWNILVFIVVFTLINLLNYKGNNTPIFPFTTFMCFMLMLFLLIHGLYDRKALSFCLYGIAFGGIFMSVFFALGVGITIDDDFRLVMFGENSNALGIYMGISSIIIINEFILNNKLNIGFFRFLFIIPLASIVGLLFATGSRTAFLIFALSLFIILLLFQTHSFKAKLALIFLFAIILLFCFIRLESSSSVLIDRLATTVDEGNTSGRDVIFKSLLPFVFDSPIIGYGQTGYVDISRCALGKISVIGGVEYGYSPHNVILEILLYTGIIGLFLWITFWWSIGKKSYLIYRNTGKLMPILLCVPMLACILSGQLINSKWAYIAYAYVLVEYYYFNSQHETCEEYC